MGMTIRRMTKADIADVAAVAITSWHTTYAGIIPIDIQTKYLQRDYSEEALLFRLEHTHFFLALIGEKVVGFANFSLADKNGEVELGTIYLLPSVIGQGIGSALLDTGMAHIDGISSVLVHVEKHNQRAIQFYERKGFVFVKKVCEIFYGQPVESYRYLLTR